MLNEGYPQPQQIDDLTEFFTYLRQKQVLDQTVTEDMAINAANFTRFYPTASGELTAAIGLSGYEYWEEPLREVVLAEQRAASGPHIALNNMLKTASRATINTLDSMMFQYRNKWLNTGIRMWQGESPGEAYRNAGVSPLGAAMLGSRRGYDVTSGEGWLPNDTDLWDNADFRQQYMQSVQAADEAGVEVNFEDLSRQTAQQVGMPFNFYTASHESAAKTMIQSTTRRSARKAAS